MSKQVITDAILGATNIRQRDADTLASVILVAMQNAIAKGELRLSGVGSFSLRTSEVVPATPISIDEIASLVLQQSPQLGKRKAKAVSNAVLSKIFSESSPAISVAGYGDYSRTPASTAKSAQSVDFKPFPVLLEIVSKANTCQSSGESLNSPETDVEANQAESVQ